MTPEFAALLLRRNPGNRALKKQVIAGIVADIRRGAWTLNGETVIVSAEGLLNDGQNRLTAIVEAERTVPVMIAFGLERSSRLTVDQSGQRTAADYVSMQIGKDSATEIAAVARLLWQWAQFRTIDTTGSRTKTNAIPKPEIAALAADREVQIRDWLGAIPVAMLKPLGCSRSLLAFTFGLLAEKDRNSAADFMRLLIEGGAAPNSPINTLRNRFITETARGPRALSGAQRLEMMLRTWNRVRAGDTEAQLVKSLGIMPPIAR